MKDNPWTVDNMAWMQRKRIQEEMRQIRLEESARRIRPERPSLLVRLLGKLFPPVPQRRHAAPPPLRAAQAKHHSAI